MCLDSLIQQLTKEGFKVTPQRKLLLEILQKSEGHLSAEDIFEEIRASQPNVSFGTVYRNLGILCDLGVVTQLYFKDGRSRFEISSGHHHHLVCLDCGNAIDVPMCPFSKTISDTAIANNFFIKHHNFEVYGYCGECREKEEETKEEARGKHQEV
jgi:Fur family ferric uptake transcriptional regulator